MNPSSLVRASFVLAVLCQTGCVARSGSDTGAPSPAPAPAPESAPSRVSVAAPGKTYPRPTNAELRRTLTPIQYDVTRNEGTEPPFRNAYWDNHEEGLYVDIVSGEPLFTSRDKFESGTGWPSFTRPLEPAHVLSHTDQSFGMSRTEVRSRDGDSHLGHVFDDGPAPTGLRYCINSAALRFIPVARLQAEGYGEYRALFHKLDGPKPADATASGH